MKMIKWIILLLTAATCYAGGVYKLTNDKGIKAVVYETGPKQCLIVVKNGTNTVKRTVYEKYNVVVGSYFKAGFKQDDSDIAWALSILNREK